MFWIVRLTDNGQYDKELLPEFFNRHTNLKMIHEYKSYNPNLGPHYQGWIDSDQTEDTIRKWFQSELKCKGNKDYSIKSEVTMKKQYKSREGYYRYVCKSIDDTTSPSIFFNLSEEEVIRLHKEFYENREDWKNELVSEKQTMNKQLENLIYSNQATLSISPPQAILTLIIEFYDTKDKMISNSQLENKYIYYRQKLFPEFKEYRVQLIHEKLILRN